MTCADVQSASCIHVFVTPVQQNDEVTVMLPFSSTFTRSLYPYRAKAHVMGFALMVVPGPFTPSVVHQAVGYPHIGGHKKWVLIV